MSRIYEDMIFKKVPENRYEVMNEAYEREKTRVNDKILNIQSYIDEHSSKNKNSKAFIEY